MSGAARSLFEAFEPFEGEETIGRHLNVDADDDVVSVIISGDTYTRDSFCVTLSRRQAIQLELALAKWLGIGECTKHCGEGVGAGALRAEISGAPV